MLHYCIRSIMQDTVKPLFFSQFELGSLLKSEPANVRRTYSSKRSVCIYPYLYQHSPLGWTESVHFMFGGFIYVANIDHTKTMRRGSRVPDVECTSWFGANVTRTTSVQTIAMEKKVCCIQFSNTSLVSNTVPGTYQVPVRQYCTHA
jgi:hypothetical protein